MPTTIRSGTNWPEWRSKINDFMTKNIGRLPVAVRIDSTNPLQLIAFLATARTFIEQTGPGLTTWESLKYKVQGYVRVSPVKGQPGVTAEVENLAIYYTTVGGALTVTLSEAVLKKAIERAVDKKAPASPRFACGFALARLERRAASRSSLAGGRQFLRTRPVSGPHASPELEQFADPPMSGKRLFPRSRSGGRASRIVGRDARLPWRRKIRLERTVRHDGIDRLRTSRAAKSRARPLRQ